MGLTEKYGFGYSVLPVEAPAVQFYIHDHLRHYNYPPDVVPSSQIWFGILREEKIWGVVGIKPLGEKSVEIPDFYLHRSRWGTLAGYAALEMIRDYAEKEGIEVITVTPVWNTNQMKAQAKVFGVDGPTHHVYRFRPEEKAS